MIFTRRSIADFRLRISDWTERGPRLNLKSEINNLQSTLRFFGQRLLQDFAGDFGRATRHFGDHPLHLAGPDLILGDAARLAGGGLDRWRRSTLELPCTPRGHQDVPVIAVKPFDQFHYVLPG